jgi:RNA polymerase sigma-70 factor (ECF subfamily)
VLPENEARFASLYERHRGHVAAFCQRRAGADAVEDLIAEVFLTVWRKIDGAPTGEDALRRLYRISYLVITNHWRRSGRTKKLARKLESINISTVTSLSDQVVMRSELRRVLEAVSRLRPRDQEVLRLSLWEQLSHQDTLICCVWRRARPTGRSPNSRIPRGSWSPASAM